MDFRTVREDVNGQYDTYFELPEKDNKKLIIEYGGFPTVAQCMMPSVTASIGENYIYLSHTDIAPFLKNYGLAYGTVGLEVTMPDDLTPFIFFEPLTEFDENGDGTRTYKTRLDIDYIYNFVAGNYVMDQFSSSENINFNFIYGDIYSSVVDEYNVRQSICDVYDYCTRHYGRSPFTAEGVFKLFQRSSIDQGGFAVSRASTWSEDTITPNTLSDPNRGANAVEIFIHEMIHQWWGGVGMCATIPTDYGLPRVLRSTQRTGSLRRNTASFTPINIMLMIGKDVLMNRIVTSTTATRNILKSCPKAIKS